MTTTPTPPKRILMGEDLGAEDIQQLCAAIEMLSSAADNFGTMSEIGPKNQALELAKNLMHIIDTDIVEETEATPTA